MTDPLARLRLPLRITALAESFVIRDAAGLLLPAVYFDGEGNDTERSIRQRMTREEAEEVVKVCARALTERLDG